MSLSSRFAIAIHALCVLVKLADRDVPSSLIATSINTNPVVVRRILASLKAAGIVQTREGAEGGYRLACCPRQLGLDRVFAAVEPGPLFTSHSAPPNPDCPIGARIAPVLAGLFAESQQALARELAAHSLAEFAATLEPVSP